MEIDKGLLEAVEKVLIGESSQSMSEAKQKHSGILWKYEDAIGIERKGYYVSSREGQGNDVSYTFSRKDGSGIDVVSGSRLKKAQRIYESVALSENNTTDFLNKLEDLLATLDKSDPLRDSLEKTLSSYAVIHGKTKAELEAKNPTRKSKAAKQQIPLEVGDILMSYWSYTMSWPDYFQITDVVGKKVTVRHIDKTEKSGHRYHGGQMIPLPNKFTGNPVTFTVRGELKSKEDFWVKKTPKELDAIGSLRYLKPNPDGSYPTAYENHMD